MEKVAPTVAGPIRRSTASGSARAIVPNKCPNSCSSSAGPASNNNWMFGADGERQPCTKQENSQAHDCRGCSLKVEAEWFPLLARDDTAGNQSPTPWAGS